MKKTGVNNARPKKNKQEIDFTNVSIDDIARLFLETPPKPKQRKKNKKKEDKIK